MQAIANHQPTGNPATNESFALRDADLLETIGAVGILRFTSKVGRDTRYPTFSQVLQVLQKNIQLASLLHFEHSKQLASKKIQLVESFIAAAYEEANSQPL